MALMIRTPESVSFCLLQGSGGLDYQRSSFHNVNALPNLLIATWFDVTSDLREDASLHIIILQINQRINYMTVYFQFCISIYIHM